MSEQQVIDRIELELANRGKRVLNKNAFQALLAALSNPIDGLGKLFLGRQDALDAERTKIQQEIILQLLCKIDEALGEAINSGQQKGVIVAGLIQAKSTNGDEVTGLEISKENVRIEAGTRIQVEGNGTKIVTGVKIS